MSNDIDEFIESQYSFIYTTSKNETFYFLKLKESTEKFYKDNFRIFDNELKVYFYKINNNKIEQHSNELRNILIQDNTLKNFNKENLNNFVNYVIFHKLFDEKFIKTIVDNTKNINNLYINSTIKNYNDIYYIDTENQKNIKDETSKLIDLIKKKVKEPDGRRKSKRKSKKRSSQIKSSKRRKSRK